MVDNQHWTNFKNCAPLSKSPKTNNKFCAIPALPLQILTWLGA